MKMNFVHIAVFLACSSAALGQPVFNNPPPASTSGGTGDVVGPASATPNAICRFDATTGKLIKNSDLTVADTTGNITGPAGGFTVIGGTGASDILNLDGSAATAGYASVYATGEIGVNTTITMGGDWLNFRNSGGIGWDTAGAANQGAIYGDVRLHREYAGGAVGTLAQRAGTTPQKYSIYGTADAYSTYVNTNFERLSMSCNGTGACTIATETAGTGVDNIPLTLTTAGTSGVLFRDHVVADTNGETTTAAQSATVWTNTGDTDGQTFTLLNDPTLGTHYCVAVDAAQTVTVAPSAGESLYFGTDQCVVSLTSNATGSTLCVAAVVGGSGGKWFTMSSAGSWTCND